MQLDPPVHVHIYCLQCLFLLIYELLFDPFAHLSLPITQINVLPLWFNETTAHKLSNFQMINHSIHLHYSNYPIQITSIHLSIHPSIHPSFHPYIHVYIYLSNLSYSHFILILLLLLLFLYLKFCNSHNKCFPCILPSSGKPKSIPDRYYVTGADQYTKYLVSNAEKIAGKTVLKEKKISLDRYIFL